MANKNAAPDVCSEDSPDYDAEACAKLRKQNDGASCCDESSPDYDEEKCKAYRAKQGTKDSTSVHLVDTAVIDKAGTRLTADGYLVATARVARTGIQVYSGDEVGDPERGSVRVYRPETTVFDAKSLQTFAHKPVTLHHPGEMVNSENWRDYAVGHVDGEIMRDGDMIRVPMMVTDAAAIKAIQGGANQLSVGYDARLEIVDGFTDAGEAYDAIQHDIRVNHIALTPAARGGPQLRLGDNNRKDQTMDREPLTTRTVTIDGIEIKLADTSASIVQAGMKKLRDSVASLTTERDTLSGQVVALQQQLKDATVTDADLDKRVADRQVIVSKAQSILGKDWQPDGKSAADIRRAVVAKKLGDEVAKPMTDAAVEGAFAAVTVDVATTQKDGTRELALALARPGNIQGGDDAWEQRGKLMREAWRGNNGAVVQTGQSQ